MAKICFYAIRFVLGLYFILYGIKGLGDLTSTNITAVSHIDIIQKHLTQYIANINLELIKTHSHMIIQVKNLAILYGGAMMLFGLSTSKLFTFLGLAVEMAIVASLRIHNDEMSFCSFSAYLSLIGVVLSI